MNLDILGFQTGRWLLPLIVLVGWFIVDRIVVKKLVGKLFDGWINNYRSKNADEIEAHELQARMNRFATLKRLAVDILRWGLGAVAALMLLSTLGIDIVPILTGLGIAGLAISLAAQNIIRDFLYGIFVVLENQYAVGDVVKIAGHFGTVDRFNLRTTHLTDLDGNYIIVPNSAVTEVLNATKHWSQAQVVVGVAYDTDIRKALEVMEEAGKQVKAQYPGKIIDDPVIQGILEFEDSAITLRALIKTHAGEHWFIGREYRLLLKEAFDAAGISIPFPQQDLWLRNPETLTAAAQNTRA